MSGIHKRVQWERTDTTSTATIDGLVLRVERLGDREWTWQIIAAKEWGDCGEGSRALLHGRRVSRASAESWVRGIERHSGDEYRRLAVRA